MITLAICFYAAAYSPLAVAEYGQKSVVKTRKMAHFVVKLLFFRIFQIGSFEPCDLILDSIDVIIFVCSRHTEKR